MPTLNRIKKTNSAKTNFLLRKTHLASTAGSLWLAGVVSGDQSIRRLPFPLPLSQFLTTSTPTIFSLMTHA
jgi:hypothetical protein